MAVAEQTNPELEEFGLFVERLMDFMNLWTVYNDFLTGRYVPSTSRQTERSRTDIQVTLMFILYAFFYSLIEDDVSSVNAFRIWRKRYPEEEAAIGAVEAKIAPFTRDLRVFRNRLGFHGSLSRKHEAAGLELFANHKGDAVLDAMKKFKSFAAALLAKENAEQGLPGCDANKARQWIDSFTS